MRLITSRHGETGEGQQGGSQPERAIHRCEDEGNGYRRDGHSQTLIDDTADGREDDPASLRAKQREQSDMDIVMAVSREAIVMVEGGALEVPESDVTDALERYDALRAAQEVERMVDDLSNWYVRRNRRRFWKGQLDDDKREVFALCELEQLTAPAVAEICRRLDGIPLAIELAAARVRVLAPAQIAAGLSDRFGLLTGGVRRAPARQQTLGASLDWSYALLDDAQRLAFARLLELPTRCDTSADVAELKPEIATSLQVSFQTVNTPSRRMYEKLHVHSRSGAVAKALKERLI